MGDMWARQQIHTWVSGGDGGSQKPGLVDTKGDPGPRCTHQGSLDLQGAQGAAGALSQGSAALPAASKGPTKL